MCARQPCVVFNSGSGPTHHGQNVDPHLACQRDSGITPTCTAYVFVEMVVLIFEAISGIVFSTVFFLILFSCWFYSLPIFLMMFNGYEKMNGLKKMYILKVCLDVDC